MSLLPPSVRDGFLRLLDPIVNAMIRRGIRPNGITTVGAVILVGAGVAFGAGLIRAGGFLLLLSGVFDLVDGRVARGGSMATAFGAFYDSTLDRVGEALLFTGILVWFVGPAPAVFAAWGAALAMIALAGSLIVSYTRARAEALGVDCKVGIAPRAERVLVLGVPALFVGAGPRGEVLLATVALLAFVTSVTVVQRVVYVRRVLRGDQVRRRAPDGTRTTRPIVLDHSHKG